MSLGNVYVCPEHETSHGGLPISDVSWTSNAFLFLQFEDD